MSRWPNKYVIGLTGNIAVGKSVVRQMLQHLGAYTIDADGLTHQAMAPGAPAYAPVVDMFGKFLLDSEGKINRSILGHIVFTYPEALTRLESMVHPVVVTAINTLITRAKQRVIVVEAIKLLETDLAGAVDVIWVVDAPPEVQLRRLTEKRQMSEDEARRRILAQHPQLDKVAKANKIIRNDTSVDETWKQVQAAWNDVRVAIGEKAVTNEHEAVVSPKTNQNAQPAKAAPQQTANPAAAAPAQQVKAPTQAAPAQAASPAAAAPAAPGAIEVVVKRGMPGNAEQIANFISKVGQKRVDRMDIMLSFGQKSYLLAQASPDDRVVALIGWQVENLITRADEFYIEPTVPREPVVGSLIAAIEEQSKELQSEVGFILLPANSTQDTLQSFLKNGYESTTLEEIRIPAWREAVTEIMGNENPRIFTKKLRADRVMKPI